MVYSDVSLPLKVRKKAAILDAAVDVFSEVGFDGASMDLVAETAQVSKRTVYNHFPSKDALFSAIVERLRADSSAAGVFPFDPQASSSLQLYNFGIRVVDFHCQPESRRLARIILPRLLKVPSLGKELLGNARFFEAELNAWLSAAIKAGRIRKAEVSTAARQFLGLLESAVVWPQLFKHLPSPSRKQRGQIVTETVAMFLAYYQK